MAACSDDVIAGVLNRNDLRTGHGNRWTRERVTSLRGHYEIPICNSPTREAEGWMNLTQAATFLGISPKTLRLATEQGEIEALHPLQDGPWLFKRSALQTDAARHLVERARSRHSTPAGHADLGPAGGGHRTPSHAPCLPTSPTAGTKQSELDSGGS
jgi:hypothetical protein